VGACGKCTRTVGFSEGQRLTLRFVTARATPLLCLKHAALVCALQKENDLFPQWFRFATKKIFCNTSTMTPTCNVYWLALSSRAILGVDPFRMTSM